MLDTGSEVGQADVGFAEPGALPEGEVIYQYTAIDATLAGSSLEDIISLKCSYGWDQAVSTADIVLRTKPATGYYLDPVTVTVNGVLRFVGIMAYDWDFTGWPESVVLHAKSELTRAEQYRLPLGDLDTDEGQPGLTLSALLGGPESGTLKQIVSAVLTRCNVSYDPANFADPPHIYGVEAPEEFTWRQSESGLAYLHRLFEASAGYRVFHSGDGKLYLAQIVGRPRGAADFTLSYGTHILEGAHAKRSVAKTFNTVVVRGLDDGAGDGPLQYPDPPIINAANALQPGPEMFVITVGPSAMIETVDFAQDLADNYWVPEVNREIWTASVPTWLDVVMGPGQTVMLDATSAPWPETSELGVGEPGWMLGFTLDVSERGELVQTAELVGGGLPADYVPPPI